MKKNYHCIQKINETVDEELNIFLFDDFYASSKLILLANNESNEHVSLHKSSVNPSNKDAILQYDCVYKMNRNTWYNQAINDSTA